MGTGRKLFRWSKYNKKFVNDVTERGVKLTEEYIHLTKDEDQRQYLLKIVDDYRKSLPKVTKLAIILRSYNIIDKSNHSELKYLKYLR